MNVLLWAAAVIQANIFFHKEQNKNIFQSKYNLNLFFVSRKFNENKYTCKLAAHNINTSEQ